MKYFQNRPNAQIGLRQPRTPGRAALVLSAPGVRLRDDALFGETPLQWPRRRLQWLEFAISHKTTTSLNLGSALALPWGQGFVSRAALARVMTGHSLLSRRHDHECPISITSAQGNGPKRLDGGAIGGRRAIVKTLAVEKAGRYTGNRQRHSPGERNSYLQF
jgi:hypothetical protein